MKKIFIILAAYNEEEAIKKVINDVRHYADRVVVVDDGSTDRTGSLVSGKNTVLLRHFLNLGQGAALQTGFDYAVQNGADIVVTYDADGQFRASEIPQLTKPIIEGKADVVLGSRFLGKAVNISPLRLVTLKLAIIFTRIFSDLDLTDTHNGFRAMNRRALQKIRITYNGMAHASEIIDEIKREKLKFVEVPVTVTYNQYTRKKSQSSFAAFRIFTDLLVKKLYY
ncbi:MAG: glycosyltransferase family 2 protein [bacterium]|nr:glycosyltransferase family 2 protein [bacterium]